MEERKEGEYDNVSELERERRAETGMDRKGGRGRKP